MEYSEREHDGSLHLSERVPTDARIPGNVRTQLLMVEPFPTEQTRDEWWHNQD